MIAATVVSAGLVAAASDSGSNGFDTNTVTPGVAGFVAIFLVAAAIVLLLLDMTRRVRRVRYRGEIGELLDAEAEAEASEAEATEAEATEAEATEQAAGDRAKRTDTDRAPGLEPPA